MQAICYSCGGHKTSPLKVCGKCQTAPSDYDDQVLSLCLSLECVKAETLSRCRKYFKTKNKPPRFKENVIKVAKLLLDEQLANNQSNQSMEFSSSMFEFSDLSQDEPRRSMETVTAHIIGRAPNQEADDAQASLGKNGKTYHKRSWVVGTDIDQEMYDANKDGDGDVYVWYRWINNQWTWSCIGKSHFDQLKSVELGRVS